jgi:type VI secretion system protein ImpK
VAEKSLARLAGDYIAFVQLLAQAPADAMPEPQALRSRLLALLEPVSKGSAAEGIPTDEVEEARFALVAWADETLLRREWAGRAEWQRETLQLQIFRTARGGNEFYEHLARLRPEQNAAREVYFLTLVLGFEGQYATSPADRQALIQHQFETLRAAGVVQDAMTETPVAPTAYELDISLPRAGGWGVLGWLGLGVVGLAVFYGVVWGVLALVGGDVPVPRGG